MLNNIARAIKLVTGRVGPERFLSPYYQKELPPIDAKVNESTPVIKVFWNVKILFISKFGWN